MKKNAILLLLFYFGFILILTTISLTYPFKESDCFSNSSNEISSRFESYMKRIAQQEPGVFEEIYVKAFLIDTEGSLIYMNGCENLPSAINILKGEGYSDLEKKAAIVYMYKLDYADYMNFSERAYSLYKGGLITPEHMADIVNPYESFWATISNYRWVPKWRHFLKRVKNESNNPVISKAVDQSLEKDLFN